MFAAVFAVSSWITVPFGPVPFTLQTFAITLSVYVIGGRRTAISLLVYLFAGAVGVPVFSGFKGGVGVLLGLTGGYLLGFLLTVPVDGVLIRLSGGRRIPALLGTAAGLLFCYVFGTAWLMCVYSMRETPVTVLGALNVAVFPFIIPDIAKLVLANVLGKRLKPVADRILQ